MDVLHSGFLDSILELREDDLEPGRAEVNWFSSINAQKLYDSYVAMDLDENGMLSRSELKRFGETKATFTDAFVNRFFEENNTYDGEIVRYCPSVHPPLGCVIYILFLALLTQDFKCFVDLVLAIQNKKEAAAVHYFFRILDVNRKGYLEQFTLYYFFKDIITMLQQNGQEVLDFNDICTEIFDIVKPITSNQITCQDLINCSQADVVITLLTDFSGFNEYETRDLPAADAPLEEGDTVVV